MRAVAIVALLLVACSVLAAVSRASGVQRPSPLVDLTVSCAVPVRAGVRELEVSANSGVRLREDTSKWLRLAHASASPLGGQSVFVSAGAPVVVSPGASDDGARVYAHSACRPHRAAVQLSRRGLSGGAAGQLGDRWDCAVPKQVVIRVRALFRRPTTVRTRRYGIPGRSWTARVANGTVERGWLAVRTPGGKPVAYADVQESGRARLFVARSCIPD